MVSDLLKSPVWLLAAKPSKSRDCYDSVGEKNRVKMRSTPIRARTRKLRARWTSDKNQDLHAFYDIRAKRKLLEAVDNYQNYERPMRQIKVNKASLLEIIKKNREEHRGMVEEAQKKFREVAIKALDITLRAALNGKAFELRNLSALFVPEDHTRDYDRSIQMLEMSVEVEVMVSEQEFQNYVQDIWGWSRDWAMKNCTYMNENSRYYGKVSAMASTDE